MLQINTEDIRLVTQPIINTKVKIDVYDERNMTAYINKIRRKIEPNPARPRYILTVWGVGYKFNGEIEPADNVE